MNLLHKLYLIRFSLVAGGFLLIFPIAVLWLRVAGSLLAGMFDVEGFSAHFWLSLSAYLLSWSAIITLRITSLYGPERVGMAPQDGTRFVEGRLASQIVFVIGVLLPIPLLATMLTNVFNRWALAGTLSGALLAFLLVYVSDLIHRLFNTFHGSSTAGSGKDLFFPFKNRLSEIAERTKFVERFFKRRQFEKVSKLLWRLPRNLTVGYVKHGESSVTVNPGMIVPLVMFVLFLFLYALGFYYWAVRPEIDLGITTISFLFVLVTFLCWLFAGLGFFFDRFRLPTILVLLLIVIFARMNHTYEVSSIPDGTQSSYQKPKDIIEARKGDKYIILVAANGGGIQSSAWTTEILTRFSDHCEDVDGRSDGCRNAIAAISGVSGGSVGSMYFMEAFNSPGNFDSRLGQKIRQYSRTSSLSYVGGTMLFQDLVRNIPFVSLGLETDRGRRIATGWAENKAKVDSMFGSGPATPAGSLDLTAKLSSLRPRETNSRIPALIFNSTIVETGQRLLFSTTDFAGKNNPSSSEWLTLDDIAGHRSDIAITEAVRLSAAFPYVSPAPHMSPEESIEQSVLSEYRNHHVADGGYADNYGMLSIRDFVNEGIEEVEFHPESKPVFIILQILGEQTAVDPKEGTKRSSSFGFFSWFEQFLAPLSTLLHVRQTGQFARNGEAYSSISNSLNSKGLKVRHFIFEYPSADAPLSWHLTPGDIEKINTAGESTFTRIDTAGLEEGNARNIEQWRELKNLISELSK